MIAKLAGRIDSFFQNYLILDVGGVGYMVFASARTLSRIGQTGDSAALLIDTQVREDAFNLYGFMDAAEQQWFRLLTGVQGVGAKAALAILSAVPPEQLGFAIAAGDAAMLRRADGVGPKLATRIVTELKDKAGKIDLQMPKTGAPSSEISSSGSSELNADNDAVSALINLGYSRSDAYKAVLNARKTANDNAGTQDLIRLALKELGKTAVAE